MLSDKRIKHTFGELSGFIKTLYKFTQILLDELAEQTLSHTYKDKRKQDYLIQSIARSRVQIKSVFLLFELKHYSDMNILMRNMAEKLLILYDLVDNNNFTEFYNFSIVSNFEIRNKIKSDANVKQNLNTKFWSETKERQKSYELIKCFKTKWVRPNSSRLEVIAKKHDLLEIYKYCYKTCSGFVHPTYSDGAEEFVDFIAGLEKVDDFESRISYLNNSTLMFILTLEIVVNELEGKKHPLIFSFINSSFDFIRDKKTIYKECFSQIEEIKFKEMGKFISL